MIPAPPPLGARASLAPAPGRAWRGPGRPPPPRRTVCEARPQGAARRGWPSKGRTLVATTAKLTEGTSSTLPTPDPCHGPALQNRRTAGFTFPGEPRGAQECLLDKAPSSLPCQCRHPFIHLPRQCRHPAFPAGQTRRGQCWPLGLERESQVSDFRFCLLTPHP